MRKLDKKILLQLVRDAEQSISEIAKKTGTTRQTVAKKIKRFKEAGIVRSFVARLNPEKFGFSTRAYVFLREDSRSELRRKNEKTIKKFPQVTGFHRFFGRYSAILEVWTRDSRELSALVKKIHKLKGVRETETFIIHSTVKDQPGEPFVQVLKS